ncbi:MAG: hypothetical protein RL641_186 [Candidatus Parcubacteria bacterium]|jgi:hypothetical protein
MENLLPKKNYRKYPIYTWIASAIPLIFFALALENSLATRGISPELLYTAGLAFGAVSVIFLLLSLHRNKHWISRLITIILLLPLLLIFLMLYGLSGGW